MALPMSTDRTTLSKPDTLILYHHQYAIGFRANHPGGGAEDQRTEENRTSNVESRSESEEVIIAPTFQKTATVTNQARLSVESTAGQPDQLLHQLKKPESFTKSNWNYEENPGKSLRKSLA